MKELNLTATKFADKIGVQRSSISHIMSGRNQPSFDFILKILEKIPDVNTEWLITGKGNMFKSEMENSNNKEMIDEKKAIRQNGVILEDHVDISENRMKTEKNSENQIKKVTNVNNPIKIIIFYEDRTFIEYLPRQEG